MARIPTPEEIAEAQRETRKKINDKRSKQVAQGKDFVIPEDNHGAGVVPEAIWKNLPGKKLDDPEAIE